MLEKLFDTVLKDDYFKTKLDVDVPVIVMEDGDLDSIKTISDSYLGKRVGLFYIDDFNKHKVFNYQ